MCKEQELLNLQIPDGYVMMEREEQWDLEEAVKMLKGRGWQKYSFAIKDGTRAILRKDLIKCPYCGYEYPANARALFPEDPCYQRFFRVSRAVIDDWGTFQMGFCDDEERKLMLNKAFYPENLYCNHCGHESAPVEGQYQVRLSRQGHLVHLSVNLMGLEDLMRCRWMENCALDLGAGLYERVTFNFRNGHTYLQLCSGTGDRLVVRDITNDPEKWEGTLTYAKVACYRQVRRKLVAAFAEQWKAPLPLLGLELQPEGFMQMARFVGYPRDFYDGIPYRKGSKNLERSFHKAADRMQSTAKAEQWLKGSKLPFTKNIRRCFYQSPALFFYLPEAEGVWQTMPDLNVMARFLRAKNVYEILLQIHCRPGILELFRDLCRVKGAVYMMRRIEEDWDSMRRYASVYVGMSSHEKKSEQQRWKKHVCLDIDEAPEITVPVTSVPRGMADCVINGYRFHWLRTNDDYINTGRHMHNCLVDWCSDDYPVVCVTRFDEYVAAIEVRERNIAQILAPHNDPVPDGTPFDKALDIWKKRFGITHERRRHLIRHRRPFHMELDDIFRRGNYE